MAGRRDHAKLRATRLPPLERRRLAPFPCDIAENTMNPITRFRLLPLLALVLLVASNAALAQRPPLVVPTDPALVLETLPAGYRGFSTPALPGEPLLPRIQAMLDTAARTGDTRLSTRAQALLERLPANVANSPDALRARAFSAQHRHDFDQARALLGQVLAREPGDGGALLSRAQVNIVQGHLNQARSDCAVLALRVDADLGIVCTAALQLRMGDYPSAARLADRWLSSEGGDPGLTRFVLMMRGDIASRLAEPDATRWFERALALDPGDVRTRLAFARHLRRVQQPREALAMLATATESDTVLLQRALAARESGSTDAAVLSDRLGKRFQLARQTGSATELRDEAEYHLALRNDAARGLQLALENFRTQRDREDQELLQSAARAAKRPNALVGMTAWAKTERLRLDAEMEGAR